MILKIIKIGMIGVLMSNTVVMWGEDDDVFAQSIPSDNVAGTSSFIPPIAGSYLMSRELTFVNLLQTLQATPGDVISWRCFWNARLSGGGRWKVENVEEETNKVFKCEGTVEVSDKFVGKRIRLKVVFTNFGNMKTSEYYR